MSVTSDTDPYKVLRLPKSFTLEQLKMNYRRLALQLHPDKNVVSGEHAAEIFKILTSSYKALLHVHELRESDKQFGELRTDSKRHVVDTEEANEARRKMTQQNFKGGDGHFDPDKFNRFFSDNKLADPVNDTGYGDWLRTENPVDRPMSQSSRKTAVPKECQALMMHVDSLAFGKSKLSYSEMGIDEIDDFSLLNSGRSVGATDLRVAYSSRKDEEDGPSAGNTRREYKDLDDLERDRANIAYSMNDKESRAYDTYKKIVDKRESSQQSHIRFVDKTAEKHFGKIQRMLTTT